MSRLYSKITLALVKKSISKENLSRQPFSRRILFQPLADLLTPCFANAGWSASGVTHLRGVLSVIVVLTIPFFVSPYISPIVALIIIFLIVLDFVDGNLARVNDQASYYGKYLDGYYDFFLPSFLLPSIGCLLTLRNGDKVYLLVGLSVALVSCYLWFTRERVRAFVHYMHIELGSSRKPLIDYSNRQVRDEKKFAALMQNVRNFSYFWLLIPDFGMVFFCFSVFYLALSIPVWFVLHHRVARSLLNVGKISSLDRRR